MSFRSNAHTHTTYCDGLSTARQQIEAAQALHFVSLGFTGHAMQGFDWRYCMSAENQRAYRDELLAARAALTGEGQPLKLYIGLEQDTLVPADEKARNRKNFDYLLGSTHYFPEPLEGEWVAVDGSPELLSRCIQTRFAGDALAMAQAYFQLHGAYVAQDQPDVIGHFDLVRKYAARIGLNTDATAYRSAALDALKQARSGCPIMEVNTGNIARGYDILPYPAAFLLDAWQDMGGALTLTSDCHDASLLTCAFDETLRMLAARGWKTLRRLGAGESLWDEVEIAACR